MNTSIFVWNCQGAAANRFHCTLKSLLQDYKPSIIALVEPRTSGPSADRIIKKIGYPNSHRVEASGFSGGIWLLWTDHISLRVLANHRQFIHTEISDAQGNNKGLFTAVYGSPNATLREVLWHELSQLYIPAEAAWILAGDFNATIDPSERRGDSPRRTGGCRAFKHFIFQNGLVDLGFAGPQFTWQRGRLHVRLDRALANAKWVSLQPNNQILHLPRIHSDHRPIMIKPEPRPPATDRPFKFLAAWALHPSFTALVEQHWSNERSLPENLEIFKAAAT